ncbi:hypothetical protein C2G38_2047659 [Gigaspora rosea]|uniref:Uncharacterized protein n=1 Tax=Gigaspora rosea TaxID=44941 RepID=A0A397U8F1_9GLOM|nr:hypothetical protein C2G38_2047659 [Gigaspora rosea]
MVMIMFVPIEPNKRDPDSQAVFEKDHYYVVSGKIVLEIYRGIKRVKMTISTSTCVSINKIPDSNNCPMRVSVVGIVQNEVEKQLQMMKMLLLKFQSTIIPLQMLISCELEIIKDNIYIYAKDINYVELHIEVKKQVFDSYNSQNSTMLSISTQSKLLATYRSIAESSGNVPRPSTLANTINLDNFECEVIDYKSEALKDYDTTNEYFDKTQNSDMKDEEESSDDSFYTKNMCNKSRGCGR